MATPCVPETILRLQEEKEERLAFRLLGVALNRMQKKSAVCRREVKVISAHRSLLPRGAAKEELEANFDAIDRVFPRHGEEKGERLVARWLGVCARSKYVTQLRTGKEFGRGQKAASRDTFFEATP